MRSQRCSHSRLGQCPSIILADRPHSQPDFHHLRLLAPSQHIRHSSIEYELGCEHPKGVTGFYNTGNDTFMGLYAFQQMIDPKSATITVPMAVQTRTATRMSSMHMGVPMPVHLVFSPRLTGITGMRGMGMGIRGMYAPPSLSVQSRGLHVPSSGVGTMHVVGSSPHMNSVHCANGINGTHCANDMSKIGTLNAHSAPPVLSHIYLVMLPVTDITGTGGVVAGGNMRDRGHLVTIESGGAAIRMWSA